MRWFCLLFLTVALGAAAQTQHRVLVHFEGPQAQRYAPSLLAAVASNPAGVLVVASRLETATDAELAKEARRFVCDAVLSVTLTREQEKDRLVWTLSSPEESEPRAQGSVLKSQPDWPTVAELYWLFLGPPLAKAWAEAREWPQPPVSERAEFRVEALPGTLLVGLPSGAVTVGPEGVVVATLDLPVSVLLEGHLTGVRTLATRVFVDHAGQTVTLEQRPEPRWSVEAALSNFTFPTFGATWSPDAGRLVYRASLDQYLGGLLLQTENQKAGGLPFQSLPLVSLLVGAAWQWSWPEDQVSFYTAADLGVRFMFPQFRVLTVDPVVPVTLDTVVGWEYKWTPGQAGFFELGPTFLIVPDAQLFMASLHHNSNNFAFMLPGIPVGMTFPFQAKAGYRWAF